MRGAVIGTAIFQIIAGLILCLIVFLIMRKKTGRPISIFFIGAGTWFVFVVILEALVHNLVLVMSPIGGTIRANIFLYALYGGFMAALFEEGGRFAVFKTLLKREQVNDNTALMCGAGHGGFEAFFLLASSGISLIAYSAILNNPDMIQGAGLDDATLAQVQEAIAGLQNTSVMTYVWSVMERVSAIILHISLSVMVWFAAKEKIKKIGLLALAFFCHFFVDFITAILASKVPIAVVEMIILAMALSIAYLALRVWKKYSSPPEVVWSTTPRGTEGVNPY